jgi:hypothetical protein
VFKYFFLLRVFIYFFAHRHTKGRRGEGKQMVFKGIIEGAHTTHKHEGVK